LESSEDKKDMPDTPKVYTGKPKKGKKRQLRQFSKQIQEYANHGLNDMEQRVYREIFSVIAEEQNIESAHDKMLLHNMVMNFIRGGRLQMFLQQHPEVLTWEDQSGQTRYKVNEASYLLNAVQSQFRQDMKELLLTRKEAIKKRVFEGNQDFARWINTKEVVDVENDE